MSDNDYGRADPLANIRIRLAKVSDHRDPLEIEHDDLQAEARRAEARARERLAAVAEFTPPIGDAANWLQEVAERLRNIRTSIDALKEDVRRSTERALKPEARRWVAEWLEDTNVVAAAVEAALKKGQIRKLILRDYANESGQLLGMTRAEILETAETAVTTGRFDRWVMSKASLLVRRAAGTHDIYTQEEHEARRELVAMVKRVVAEMGLLDKSDLASVYEDYDDLRAALKALQDRIGPPEDRPSAPEPSRPEIVIRFDPRPSG